MDLLAHRTFVGLVVYEKGMGGEERMVTDRKTVIFGWK
jgi:hypothetical protein